MKRLVFGIFGVLLLMQGALVYGAAALYYVAPGGGGWDCGGTPATACGTLSAVVSNTPANDVTIRMAVGTYSDAVNAKASDFSALDISGGWNADFSAQRCKPELTVLQMKANTQTIYIEALALSRIDVELSCFSVESTLTTARLGMDLQAIAGILILNAHHMIFESVAGNAIHARSTNTGNLGLQMDKIIFRNAYQPEGSSKWAGGAIYARASSSSTQTIVLDNSLFYNNEALKGSVIHVYTTDPNTTTDLSLTNSTISGNRSIGPDTGGAISVVATSGSEATVNLRNSIVWGNENEGVARDIELYNSESGVATVNARYSDIGEVDLVASNPGIYNDDGNNLNVNPRLDSRYHLIDTSPVIDLAQCGYTLLNTYQRVAPYDDIDGEKRPGFGAILGCDMGADEASGGFCVPFKTPAGKVGVFCL